MAMGYPSREVELSHAPPASSPHQRPYMSTIAPTIAAARRPMSNNNNNNNNTAVVVVGTAPSNNNSKKRMKFGSMLVMGFVLLVLASEIKPLRDLQWPGETSSSEGMQYYYAGSGGEAFAVAAATPRDDDANEEDKLLLASPVPLQTNATTETTTVSPPEVVPVATISSSLHATTAAATRTNFSGILARAFSAWPAGTPLPCFPAEEDWKTMKRQFSPAEHGFLYLKPFKTGSSTTSGVNLRMARNVAQRRRRRRQQKLLLLDETNNSTDNNVNKDKGDFDMCKTRFDHGPDTNPGFTLFRKRDPSKSFLWTILRDPTARAISHFFHFEVARGKIDPTDVEFKGFLRGKGVQYTRDYYYSALYNEARFSRKNHDPVRVANRILRSYNFIGITERMDESFVVLMMQLNLKMGDILYLSAKGRGGYDDAGGRNTCTYIWPSFVSPGMTEYFASDEWKSTVQFDTLLYQAVNRSLDLTIDNLGRDDFHENLAKFKDAREKAVSRCLPTTVFPCDANGRRHRANETDCIWSDSGCGATCLDQVATELNLW